jgi:hypothetical protein
MTDRPPVKPFTQAWFDRLPRYVQRSDQSGDLIHYMSLIGDQIDEVVKCLDAIGYYPLDDGGMPGDTSALVDPTQAGVLGDPLKHLKWLAQLLGVKLNQADNLDGQIDAIRYASSGWRAGTKASLADAARSALSGTKWVSIEPNYAGDQWAIGIRTRVSETPDDVAVINAILAKGAKPAGFVLVNAAFTASWDTLETFRPTWDDWDGYTWTEIEETNAPVGDPGDIPDPEEPTDPGDVVAPRVLYTYPSNMTTDWFPSLYPDLLQLDISISFSEMMDWSSVNIEVTDASGTVIDATYDVYDVGEFHGVAFLYFHDGMGGAIPPDFATTYHVKIDGSSADVAGNTLGQDYEFEFSTIQNPDSVPPTLGTSSPLQGATDVATTNPIVLSFSEALDPATVIPANFTFNELRTATSTPLTQAQLDAFAAAWAGYKAGYIDSSGRVIRHDEGGDTVSEAIAYALQFAVMMRDQVTYDKVLNWGETHLKRSLPASGRSTFLSCYGWKTDSAGNVADWNHASDAELDRWDALDNAARLWGRASDLTLATALKNDIKNMFVVTSGKAYLTTDEYQVPNGHHQFSGSWISEINPSYTRPHIIRRMYERYGDMVFSQAIDGYYDMLTKITDNAGTLATTAGLPPNWCYYDANAANFGALVSGSVGWSYSRDTNYTYDAFRTVISAYMDWLYNAEPRAKAYLSGALKTFFTSEWTTKGNIAAEYVHDGSVLNGNRYEKNFFTNTARFALLAGDPTNTAAAAMLSQKLSNTLVNNGSYQFFRSDTSGTSSSYYGDSWMFMCRAIDTGLHARLAKALTTTTTTIPVPFTLVYDDVANTVTLTPSATLNNSAQFQVAASTAITDLASNALAQSISFSFTTIAAPALPPATTPGKPWTLDYENDFLTPLDYTNDWWSPYQGLSTWGAGTFDGRQVRVDTTGTGILNIDGVRDPSRKHPSAATDCIATGLALGKRSLPVGAAWEFRARIDQGAGFGPAILIWPDSNKWPQDGEYDQWEVPKANRLSAQSNHHWSPGLDGAGKPIHSQTGASWPKTGLLEGYDGATWHVYRTEWLTNRVSYYCDGVKVLEITDPAKIETGSKMHWAAQLDMGLPGMNWIDVVNSSTPSLVRLQVDWIRQYRYTP